MCIYYICIMLCMLLSGVNDIKNCPYFTNFCNTLVFVPDKLFQLSIMFVGKNVAYMSEAHFRCSTQGVGS
jgi:hypothetical protein